MSRLQRAQAAHDINLLRLAPGTINNYKRYHKQFQKFAIGPFGDEAVDRDTLLLWGVGYRVLTRRLLARAARSSIVGAAAWSAMSGGPTISVPDMAWIQRVRKAFEKFDEEPVRKAFPLTQHVLIQIGKVLDMTSNRTMQTWAMMTMARSLALRASELNLITFGRLERIGSGPGSMLVFRIPGAATKTGGAYDIPLKAYASGSATDPVAAFEEYCIQVLGASAEYLMEHAPGLPVFPRLHGKTGRPQMKTWATKTITEQWRRVAEAAGVVQAKRITAHSGRSGLCVDAARHGIPWPDIAAALRHKSMLVTMQYYTRESSGSVSLWKPVI